MADVPKMMTVYECERELEDARLYSDARASIQRRIELIQANAREVGFVEGYMDLYLRGRTNMSECARINKRQEVLAAYRRQNP